ncbi:hypothetical protein OIU35_22815 [Boseaceae bacterium BT-24-1]|nr:hypothetical protein [Boseaceae bacterium BT-24-1]
MYMLADYFAIDSALGVRCKSCQHQWSGHSGAWLRNLPNVFACFDIELDAADMTAIAALAREGGRQLNPEGLSPRWDS